MGFEWTENIGIGASIEATDIIEIRINVDTVDDEKCAADKVSYDSDYKDGDDTSYNPGYYYDQHGTYKSGDQVGYDSTYKPGYYSDQHSTYESGDDVGALSSNYPGFQSDYHSGYQSGAYPGHLAPHV
ncbi:hypothetical protein ES703_75750 [subsurface metagenome]